MAAVNPILVLSAASLVLGVTGLGLVLAGIAALLGWPGCAVVVGGLLMWGASMAEEKADILKAMEGSE